MKEPLFGSDWTLLNEINCPSCVFYLHLTFAPKHSVYADGSVYLIKIAHVLFFQASSIHWKELFVKRACNEINYGIS